MTRLTSNEKSKNENEEKEEEKPSYLSRLILIILGIIVGIAASYLMYLGISESNFIWLFIGFILLSFVTSLINIGVRAPPPLGHKYATVSIIKCSKCDYTEIRDFKMGDYVFKEIGECKNCSGRLYIKTIYSTLEDKSAAEKP